MYVQNLYHCCRVSILRYTTSPSHRDKSKITGIYQKSLNVVPEHKMAADIPRDKFKGVVYLKQEHSESTNPHTLPK